MTTVALRFGFEDDVIRMHLARLAVLDRRGFASVRREIGEYMVGDVQDNLRDQKLADGSAMPQSARAAGKTTHYKRDNKKRGVKKGDVRTFGKTLIDHGHLRDSYTYNLRLAGLEVGSNLVYSAIHHFGGKAGRGHRTTITPRPVLGVDQRQERRMGDLLIAELRKVTA